MTVDTTVRTTQKRSTVGGRMKPENQKPNEERIRVSFTISAEARRALAVEAARRNTTMAELIEEAAAQYEERK